MTSTPDRGELAGGLRKPDVVAIEKAELADALDVPGEELIARLNALLKRQEGKHLAITPDDVAFRIDDGCGVVDLAVAALIHRAVDEPDLVMARHVLERLLGLAGERLGMLEERAINREFGEHHHLNPWIEMHGEVEPVAHGLDIRAMMEIHLDAGDGKWGHERPSPVVALAPRGQIRVNCNRIANQMPIWALP